MRRRATVAGVVALLLVPATLAGCGGSLSEPDNPTAQSCAQAFKVAKGIPSDDLSSATNQVKVQDILDSCPNTAALDAGAAPYLPKGQGPGQVEQEFAGICGQLSGGTKSAYCASINGG